MSIHSTQTLPPVLVQRLDEFVKAPTLRKREVALVALLLWLERPTHSAKDFSKLENLIGYLEAEPTARAEFQASFAELLSKESSLSLLSEAGIPSDHSFLSEVIARVSERLLPSAREDGDASRLLVGVRYSRSAVRSFLDVPPASFERLVSVLAPSNADGVWHRQHQDLQEALRLLASRVSALGLNPEVRKRGSGVGIADSPFYQIGSRTEELLVAEPEGVGLALLRWRDAVRRARSEMALVHQHMESAGVSVELIFDLKTIEACLARMEASIDLLTAETRSERITAAHQLIGRLREGRLADLSLSSLLRENLNLIARKMVERTGHSGGHYIAHSPGEYWHMWRAALGGGLLTVFTAAIKLRIYDAHLPLFGEGFLAGTNYAVSFILLQLLGLVLATKQPAATAATFAGIIRESRGLERENKLTDFVSRITSTQLAAALGNVLAVSAGALAFERIWTLFFSQSYLAHESASHVIETLDPMASGTAFYAIVTGIILWLAALAGGWFENFAVYYRLTDAVAEHPLGAKVSPVAMKKAARVLQRNLGGWSTSIVLGYLLGFTPVVGHFFGVPLDVRHVTLSSGTLALAVAHSGMASLGRTWFYHAILGIGVIFVLNLFVSFSIAAFVGLRAYDVGPREQFAILRFLIADALKSPLRFFWPDYLRKSKDTASVAPLDSN